MTPAPDDPRYAELLEREARQWGGVAADPDNPQLWDDPVLWDAALGPAWRRLVDRAAETGGRAQRAAIRIAARLDSTLHRHGWTNGCYPFVAAVRR